MDREKKKPGEHLFTNVRHINKLTMSQVKTIFLSVKDKI